MNLFFRLIWVIATAWRRSPLTMLDQSRLTLRVWPNDLDTNIHMNNGRYLTLMDLGRVDLIIRSGLWRVIRDNRWAPVIGSAKMSYRRPLDPFQRFDIVTQVLGWDDKWVYIEQRFMVGEAMHARGVVKTLFLRGREKVPTSELAAAIGHDGPSPEIEADLVAALR